MRNLVTLKSFRTENAKLKKSVSTLNDEVFNFNAKIKLLNKELLHCHTAENNKMALLLQTLFPSPSLD